eukprot:210463_1
MEFIATALLVVHTLIPLGMGNGINLLILSDGTELPEGSDCDYDYIVPEHILKLCDQFKDIEITDFAIIPIDEDQFSFPALKIFQYLFPATLKPLTEAQIEKIKQSAEWRLLSDKQKIEVASRAGSGGMSFKALSSNHYLSADTSNPSRVISDNAKWIITNLTQDPSDDTVSIVKLQNVATNRWLRFFNSGRELDCTGNGGWWTAVRVHHAQNNRLMLQSAYWERAQFAGIEYGDASLTLLPES